MKVCTKCKIEKPLFLFGKRKDSKDGFRCDCKDCQKKVVNFSNFNFLISYGL